jgi:hypothetical protein
MSAAVAHLLSEAMLLPSDCRTELVEAILEQSAPGEQFLAEQMKMIAGRMEKVRAGASTLIPADEAHDLVLGSLGLRS